MKQQIPHPLISIIPLIVLIAMIATVMRMLPDEALSGASQISMMIATSICVALSMAVYRTKWQVFEDSIKKTIGDTSVSLLILLLIGVMSSTWMISGVVPTLIYYGVQIITPSLFLPCACIISALVSLMTGTSWTTIATIGIALLGIGNALSVPEAFTAGAIISGAYFGDKMSPMSDTTVLASSVSGADLFKHIRYMMYTTVPSITISLLLYLVMGFWFSGERVEPSIYLQGLEHSFHITAWTFLVPLFTGILIWKKAPSFITLTLSSIAAIVCAIVLQTDALMEIADPQTATLGTTFMAVLKVCYSSTQLDTGFAEVNNLVATRGMAGMLDTVWLILCAMCFGSCMVASNMLKSLTRILLKTIRNTFSLVTSTVASGVLLNLIMGDQFLSIIMNASIYKEEYADRGYQPELLSRSTEDSATVTSVLVPWTACGMTQSTVLGIPTLVYLPFCFFNIISPIMSILFALFGKIPKNNDNGAKQSLSKK
ncbi:MAG: sodium:proton antiporter [Bacteroidaceae bacterium]|nr:sodium:proton antiporter [Bacteroidaceae bacterium]